MNVRLFALMCCLLLRSVARSRRRARTRPTARSSRASRIRTRCSTSRFDSQGVSLQMAYMDVARDRRRPNGRTVVLMHGKNFCGATWEASIVALTTAGYRVVVPDQIGWCASTKPEHYQYSFQQLATNTLRVAEAARRRRTRSSSATRPAACSRRASR